MPFWSHLASCLPVVEAEQGGGGLECALGRLLPQRSKQEQTAAALTPLATAIPLLPKAGNPGSHVGKILYYSHEELLTPDANLCHLWKSLWVTRLVFFPSKHQDVIRTPLAWFCSLVWSMEFIFTSIVYFDSYFKPHLGRQKKCHY